MWIKCDGCERQFRFADEKATEFTCPRCGHRTELLSNDDSINLSIDDEIEFNLDDDHTSFDEEVVIEEPLRSTGMGPSGSSSLDVRLIGGQQPTGPDPYGYLSTRQLGLRSLQWATVIAVGGYLLMVVSLILVFNFVEKPSRDTVFVVNVVFICLGSAIAILYGWSAMMGCIRSASGPSGAPGRLTAWAATALLSLAFVCCIVAIANSFGRSGTRNDTAVAAFRWGALFSLASGVVLVSSLCITARYVGSKHLVRQLCGVYLVVLFSAAAGLTGLKAALIVGGIVSLVFTGLYVLLLGQLHIAIGEFHHQKSLEALASARS